MIRLSEKIQVQYLITGTAKIHIWVLPVNTAKHYVNKSRLKRIIRYKIKHVLYVR